MGIAVTAQAADFKPAVVYDMGGKFDKSFNEGVYGGIKRFIDETGVEVMDSRSSILPSVSRRCVGW